MALAPLVVIDDTAAVADSGTVDILVRRHHAELLRLLRSRVESHQDAADLAQEAYARLLRYEGQHSDDQLRRLLFRIVNNLLTDYWRRNQRWRRVTAPDMTLPIEELEVASNEPSHERQLTAEQRVARLEEIVAAMPERRRAVLLLSRVEGLTNSQVAASLGISIKMVEKHLALAIADCRGEVGDDGL